SYKEKFTAKTLNQQSPVVIPAKAGIQSFFGFPLSRGQD
ncbi:unnamed protein product, partial [marine sediment metagenome]